MSWDDFVWFVIASSLCWIAGAVAALMQKGWKLPVLLTCGGILLFFLFILGMWISLERPPLRTMGETRLWYSFFLPVVGVITFVRWRYRWILSFSTLMAIVFCFINLLKPEIHNKTLMPALQSPWFAPHVIVYMFAYAVLGAAFVVAVYLLWKQKTVDSTSMEMCDNLVYVGEAFLTIGMLFGAIWAKEAWGHYWSWDPKETWALIVWLNYAAWLHLRLMKGMRGSVAAWWALIGLVITTFAFLGVNMFLSGLHSYGEL